MGGIDCKMTQYHRMLFVNVGHLEVGCEYVSPFGQIVTEWFLHRSACRLYHIVYVSSWRSPLDVGSFNLLYFTFVLAKSCFCIFLFISEMKQTELPIKAAGVLWSPPIERCWEFTFTQPSHLYTRLWIEGKSIFVFEKRKKKMLSWHLTISL